MPAARQYETTYILHPELDDAERTKVKDRVKAIIEDQFGGEILKVDEWGRRPLAYKIRKEDFGYYVLTRYQSSADTIAELERILRITDPVIKFLTVRLDDDAPLDSVAASDDDAEGADGDDGDDDESSDD